MRAAEFERWMRKAQFEEGTITARINNCKWIEENLSCDLDESYRADRGNAIFQVLEYRRGQRHSLEHLIDGDPYTNLSMYRSAARLYFEFCAGLQHIKRKTGGATRTGRASSNVKLSYLPGYGPEGRMAQAAEINVAEPAGMDEIAGLWREYMGVTNRITAALGRSSNIVGEFAERLVAEYYRGKLLTASNKSADVELPDGRLVQVKSRVPRQTTTTSLSPIRSWDFDMLVVVLFDTDGSVLKALEYGTEAAKAYARRDEHQNCNLIVTTDEFLRDPQARDITSGLNALI